MNQFKAQLQKIEHIDALHQLEFELQKQKLSLLTLEPPKGLQTNCEYCIGVKSTAIALAKNLSGVLSYSNQLHANVTKITRGTIMSSVTIEIEGSVCESLIPDRAITQMDLRVEDKVVALIRGSDLFVLL